MKNWLRRKINQFLNGNMTSGECVPEPVSNGSLGLVELANQMNYAFAVYPIKGGFLLRTETASQSNSLGNAGYQKNQVDVQFVATPEELLRVMTAGRAVQKLGGK